MNRRALLRVGLLVAVFGMGSGVAAADLPASASPDAAPNRSATELGSTAWFQQQLAQQINWQGGPPPRWGGGR